VNVEQLKVNDIDEIEKQDSWKKLNERSDDEISESSGETYTSIFTSTRKIKTSVVSGINLVANAMKEKLHSPPSQPYKKWDGGTNASQDGAVFSSRSLPVTSIDEPHEEHESRHQVKSDDCDPANQEGTLDITEEPKVDATQDLTDEDMENKLALSEEPHVDATKDLSDMENKLAITEEPKVDATQDLTVVENSPTLKAQDDSPGTVVESPTTVTSKKTQWRSAVDQASGLTYYYMKGTSNVTWERPVELEQD
jgi:hypothetical protein